MKKLCERFFLYIYVLTAALFLPVLLCVIFVGSNMEYAANLKLATLLPNSVLLVIALMGAVLWLVLMRRLKMELTPGRNLIVNGVLLLLFAVLFFVNVRVAREIAFGLPWDIMVTRKIAHTIVERPLGYEYYYSMYPNNIPIIYLLSRLYRWAKEMGNYPYVFDFIWLQVNCALISLGGYFCCLTVKKLTGNVSATALGFLVYLALAGISPWKIAPYTDTYGMVFPIFCFYFYVCFRQADRVWKKYVYFALSLAGGMIGGYIKTSVYIVVIAIFGVEIIGLLRDFRKNWKFFLPGAFLVIFLAWGEGVYTDYIIDEIGLEYNEEIEGSWHHYFLMGLNEETTGSYYSPDIALFGKYETSKSARNAEEWRLAMERLKERGVFGTLYFWLRKMVMTFNDGTFGWGCEVWIQDQYPEELAGNTALTEKLRSIFWPNSAGTGRYYTFCQLAWVFCMLGIPGVFLCRKEEREKYAVLVVGFLGVFLYQLLFEARSRYLFVFLPVLIVISVCGMQQYTFMITGTGIFGGRRKKTERI
ncbi:MAG: hypothetical protein K2O06_10320 [Acetatifactor sp.]|nr:hypothetical protein [Acetatifactor sp.]